jgi:hypothetical protein
MLANSGHVMGIISEVALSFMVQDPREIIEVFRDRSRACSLYRYLHQHSHKSTATVQPQYSHTVQSRNKHPAQPVAQKLTTRSCPTVDSDQHMSKQQRVKYVKTIAGEGVNSASRGSLGPRTAASASRSGEC